jgi:hypothetical protein
MSLEKACSSGSDSDSYDTIDSDTDSEQFDEDDPEVLSRLVISVNWLEGRRVEFTDFYSLSNLRYLYHLR